MTNAVSEMIDVHNVVAVGGLNDSTFAMAAGPIAQTAGIPFVTAGATLPTLPEQIGDYFFMVPFGDDAQAFAIADYDYRTKGKTPTALDDLSYPVDEYDLFDQFLSIFCFGTFEIRQGTPPYIIVSLKFQTTFAGPF